MLGSRRLKVNLELKRGLTWARHDVYSPHLVMERKTPKTADTGRPTATALILTTVAMLAFSGADRVAVFCCGSLDDSTSVTAGIDSRQPSPPTGELPENMVPTGKTSTGPTISFLVPAVLKTDSNNGRVKIAGNLSTESRCLPLSTGSRGFILATPWLIDPDLGRQFTLVGARPSGTS